MSSSDSTSAEGPRKSNAEYKRLWRAKNPDKVREYEKRYRERAREVLAERARKYREQYPERAAASRNKYRVANRLKFKERYREERRQALMAYGEECVCCGESNLCFLTIDHAENDGCKHRNGTGDYHGSGYRIYRWLRKQGYPQDGRFQVLCYNCNCSKQHDPIGHRKAHANAKFIDGLGELDIPAH